MNVIFTSWCGHRARSTSNIGPITVLENIYFEAEGMGGWHQLSFVSLYIRQIVLSWIVV